MANAVRPFSLTSSDAAWWRRSFTALAERALGLTALQRDADAIAARLGDAHAQAGPWLAEAMRWLALDLDLPANDPERIPATGATILAAEHPTGAMEGILLLALLRQRRTDVKVLANRFLARIPALADLVLPVDVFASDSPHNPRALREAVQHLERGGALLLFPAGAVATRRLLSRGAATEAPWPSTLGFLQRRSAASVVPVHVGAANPAWFHAAGAVHAHLRTAMLAHALLAQRGRRVAVRIGHAIRAEQTARFADDDRARSEYLRLRTELLARRCDARPALAHQATQAVTRPVAARGDVAALAAEIAALPANAKLLNGNGLDVYCVHAADAPHVLDEIGRLRELTFRAVGEGSGQPRDLDRFDPSYRHLFVWDPVAQEIVGAYRLGLTDERLAAGGPRALYTSEFYDYAAPFWERLSPAIELGRSFVQPRYQKGFAPLLMLWRGIGAFVAAHPRYRHLFGTVSISADHHATSVQLMVDHLRSHCRHAELAPFVTSRAPFVDAPRETRWQPQQIADLQDVSAMVRELEVGRTGVPILMEQYLKLGARLLGVNVDPAFHTVDALVVVDLLAAPAHLLQRYLGAAGTATLQRHHCATAAAG